MLARDGGAKIARVLKAKEIDMESVKETGRLKSIDDVSEWLG